MHHNDLMLLWKIAHFNWYKMLRGLNQKVVINKVHQIAHFTYLIDFILHYIVPAFPLGTQNLVPSLCTSTTYALSFCQKNQNLKIVAQVI